MKDNLKILVLEDDFINRRLIKKTLIDFGYRIVADIDNVTDAKSFVEENQVDLAILDINLGKNNTTGVAFGQHLKENTDIPFIYLTAYGTVDIIKMAVETSPSAYLTKPFNMPDLIAAVELAFTNHTKKELNITKILIKEKGISYAVPSNEIKYIESKGNYISIYTNEKEYFKRSTIKEILEDLPENFFFRTHRSFLINPNFIDEMNSNCIIIDQKVIPIGRKYKPELLTKITLP